LYFTLKNKIYVYISNSNINMSNYKDFVEEYKISYKFSNNKNQFSYPKIYSTVNLKTSNSYTYGSVPKFVSTNNYYTAEPTEQITNPPIVLPSSESTTMQPTTMQPTTMQPTTMQPTTMQPSYLPFYTTRCPTIKNFNTTMPTINKVKIENNDLDLIIAITIPFSAVFCSIFLFVIYYYKCYLKNIKKQKQKEIEKELDLNFGLSYVDDF